MSEAKQQQNTAKKICQRKERKTRTHRFVVAKQNVRWLVNVSKSIGGRARPWANAWTATWSNSRKKQFEILNNSIVNSKYSPCKAKETRRVVRHLRDLDIKQFKQRLLFYCLLMLLGNRECAAPYTFTIANCDMIWNFIIAIKWYFFLLLIVSHTKCCSVLYRAQYYKESMINCCLLSSYSLQNGRFFLSIFRREYFATFHKYQAISKYRNWH